MVIWCRAVACASEGGGIVVVARMGARYAVIRIRVVASATFRLTVQALTTI